LPAIQAWLVTDLKSELMSELRRRAKELGTRPAVAPCLVEGLAVTPMPVTHTSHPTWGYLLESEGRRAVWAPEFWEFPNWTGEADLMFAEAAAWRRPIRFRGAVGGTPQSSTPPSRLAATVCGVSYSPTSAARRSARLTAGQRRRTAKWAGKGRPTFCDTVQLRQY
jgi:hypothetical protein